VALRRGEIRVGCSGWQYASWKGRFYPPSLRQQDWLAHYVKTFDTVEINRTFYRLPETSTFASWRQATPDDFLIVVKASRYLTHLKRLRDPDSPLERLFQRALALGDRLGPILYQLPGNMQFDAGRLRTFLAALPRTSRDVTPAEPGNRERYLWPSARTRLRHVIEFRHPSWYRPDVFNWLRRHDAALCLHDKAGSAIERGPATSFTYLRFHGTSGHYQGSYRRRDLATWSERIREWADSGRDVYAYFNNDPGAAAPRNALTLRRLIDGLEPVHRSARPSGRSPAHAEIAGMGGD
jgi:uncharacterized protein YecE (DUF72 family)